VRTAVLPFSSNTRFTQKSYVVSKVDKEFISHPRRTQRTLSAAKITQVSQALLTVGCSCLLRGRGTSFQDGVAAVEGFPCCPF
jgi:hypothetical protein